MFEKVNPAHPDKIADRIAGALVDLAYTQEKNPKIAVEVLIGHGICHIVTETSTHLALEDVQEIVSRIAGDGVAIDYQEAEQDPILAGNQSKKIRCGDNGIFRGVPVTDEQRRLSDIARIIYGQYQCDGKYIADGSRLIICQSNAVDTDLAALYPDAEINPLGYWTGGTNVDSGATNRKLGSDMADSVTGGGLHGKDLSKADVSVNIYAWLKAQEYGVPVELCCAIGDDTVDGRPMTAVYSCVRILAEAIAGLPLHVYRYTKNGGKEKAIDHPLYLLLHDEPNPEMSSFVFRETLMTHLLLWGNAYAQIIRNGKGEVIALYPLMPNKMTVDRDEKGQLYYTYQRSNDEAATMKGSTVTLKPSDVLHIQSGGIMNADDGMIMKQLVEQIIVNDDGIEVHFKCGIVASHEYL